MTYRRALVLILATLVLVLTADATVVGIDKAGHWLHHDRLDEFLRIIREFLKD